MFVKALLFSLNNTSSFIISCPKTFSAPSLSYQYVSMPLIFLYKTLFSEPDLNTDLSLKPKLMGIPSQILSFHYDTLHVRSF